MTKLPDNPEILVIGEALTDTVTHPDGHREEHPGGSPANVAITLGRLGHATRLLTDIGDDPQGQRIRDWLRESHVQLDTASVRHGTTSVARARLDPTGAAQYDIDLQWNPRTPSCSEAWLIHVGSVSAILPPGGPIVQHYLARRRPCALISYDPNIRPQLLPDADSARASVNSLVQLSDIIKVSDEDLHWLEPRVPAVDVAHRWLALGPHLVVITRGDAGARAITQAADVAVSAPITEIADTVGAGDTFMGALLSGLIGLGILNPLADPVASRGALNGATAAGLEHVLEFSARAAAITVSRAGADPPWRGELQERSRSWSA
jgi:fructokinase